MDKPINPEIPKWSPQSSNGTHPFPQPSSLNFITTILSKSQSFHLNRAALPWKAQVSSFRCRGPRWAVVVVAVAAARVTAVLGQVRGNGEEGDGFRPRRREEEGWRGCEYRWISQVWDWDSVGVAVCRLEPFGPVEGNVAFNCNYIVGIVLLISRVCVFVLVLLISCFYYFVVVVVNFMFSLFFSYCGVNVMFLLFFICWECGDVAMVVLCFFSSSFTGEVFWDRNRREVK